MERNITKKILFNGTADNQTIHLKQYEYNFTVLNLVGLDSSSDYRYIAVYKKMGDSIVYELPIENHELILSTYVTNVVGNYDFQIVAFKGDEQVAISSIFKVCVHDGVYNEAMATPSLPQPIESKYQELVQLVDQIHYDLEHDVFKGDKGDKGDAGERGERGLTGFSGVWLGSETPPSTDFRVWIDTSSEASNIVFAESEEF